MRVIETQDYYHMSRTAANIISAQIIIKPNSVIGLATGSTPIGTYEQLIRWYEKGDLDFSNVTTINLDEYKESMKDIYTTSVKELLLIMNRVIDIL